jgi:8-oxo-dGTP diphosphatase
MTRRVEVVCAILRHRDGKRILAARRPPGKALAGKWELPGGKIEPGEDPRAALQREILEELALTIAVGAELESVAHDYAAFGILLRPFLCEAPGAAEELPAAMEHSEVRWIALQDWESLDWAAADIPVLRDYFAALGSDA